MKKLIILLASLCMTAALTSCDLLAKLPTDDNPQELTVESVYLLAKENGYEGTIEEFINEFKGESGIDGVGIKSAAVDSAGHLIIEYTDGRRVDAGLAAREPEKPDNKAEMTQAAISRALLSSVSIRCDLHEGVGAYQIGSGVIYELDKASGDAYIITNYHVMYNSAISDIFADPDICVYLYGMEYSSFAISAVYIGGSADYDIAVLKVSGSDIIKDSSACAASIADSDMIEVLDSVVAVGNALGRGISATKGTVNVKSEKIATQTSSSVRTIRTDAAINHGNSGGGLFNSNGELIGIVVAKHGSSSADDVVDNMGAAIPSNTAVSIVENILYYCDGTANEKPKTISLGMACNISDVDIGYDESLDKLVTVQTVFVQRVVSNSRADLAGIEEGDVILKITVDGIEYDITQVHHAEDIRLVLRPNISIVYKVLRDGVQSDITLTAPAVEYFIEIN